MTTRHRILKIDTMRKIDHWVGVPLTFLLTWLLKPIFYFQPKKTPKRLLFIELSEMGSTILADPAMRKAGDQLQAELYFVIFANNVASLFLLNTVPKENIFTIRDKNLFIFAYDVLRFLWWTRSKKIDTVFDLELFSRVTALLTGLTGASNRIGFYRFHNEGLYRGEMLTHRVAYNPHIHIAKNFLALVNALLSKQKEVPYSKTIIDDTEIQLEKPVVSLTAKQHMQAKIQNFYPHYDITQHPIILINANASDLLPQRRWPQTHFIALIQLLLTQHPHSFILLTGAPAEQAQAQYIVDQVNHPRCQNFAGKIKFSELPALYSISQLMVTNDSGPGHFAAVTDLPTYVIFGPETPKLYGSLGKGKAIYLGLACSPCVSASNHRKTPCRDNVCIKQISPRMVYDIVKESLI